MENQELVSLVVTIVCEVLGFVLFFAQWNGSLIVAIIGIFLMVVGIVILYFNDDSIAKIFLILAGIILIVVFLIQFFTGNWTQITVPSLILGVIFLIVGGGYEMLLGILEFLGN